MECMTLKNAIPWLHSSAKLSIRETGPFRSVRTISYLKGINNQFEHGVFEIGVQDSMTSPSEGKKPRSKAADTPTAFRISDYIGKPYEYTAE